MWEIPAVKLALVEVIVQSIVLLGLLVFCVFLACLLLLNLNFMIRTIFHERRHYLSFVCTNLVVRVGTLYLKVGSRRKCFRIVARKLVNGSCFHIQDSWTDTHSTTSNVFCCCLHNGCIKTVYTVGECWYETTYIND
jgi:hypothetical protein